MFIISIFLMSGEIKASLVWPFYPILAVISLSPVNLLSKLVQRHAELRVLFQLIHARFEIKLVFIHMQAKLVFHMKSLALSLAFIMRFKETRNWPIKKYIGCKPPRLSVRNGDVAPQLPRTKQQQCIDMIEEAFGR